MKCALNKDGKRTFIEEANEKETYFCPICKKELLQRRGQIKAYHFAHFPDFECFDHWHYEMSKWHFDWQNKFKQDEQEIVKTFNDKTHRADVLLEKEKTVIEFQHSEISINEFNDRNNFYKSLGYKVIWLFDMIEEYKNLNIALLNPEEKNEKYYYRYPKKIFSSFNYKDNNLTIFFQIKGEEDINSSIKLLKITWTSPKGIYRFCAQEFDLKQFLSFCHNEKIKIVFKKNSIPYHLLQNPDSPIIVRNKINLNEYLISKDALSKYDIYHHIYGKTSNSFGEFKDKSEILNNALDPVWVVIWKPKKKK